MEQQRALNALEPYLALAKSASSPRSAADLVIQATSSPNTFVFAELLQKPTLRALAHSAEYSSHLKLLEVFAWGTFADYTATPDLPPLNANQHQKLLLLTLLPLCASPSTHGYAALQAALSLSTSRELENLITTAIYADLLHAHLDPLHQTVRVTSVAPLRDLKPGSLLAMASTLQEWEDRCSETLMGIEDEMAHIKTQAAVDNYRDAINHAVFDEKLQESIERAGGQGSGGRSDDPKHTTVPKSLGQSSRWGNLLSGGRSKRPADPPSYVDEMELDDDNSKTGNRSTRRKGLK